MNNLGPLAWYAGRRSELSKDRNTLKILQPTVAIDELIGRFSVQSTSPSPVAVNINIKLRPNKDEDQEATGLSATLLGA